MMCHRTNEASQYYRENQLLSQHMNILRVLGKVGNMRQNLGRSREALAPR